MKHWGSFCLFYLLNRHYFTFYVLMISHLFIHNVEYTLLNIKQIEIKPVQNVRYFELITGHWLSSHLQAFPSCVRFFRKLQTPCKTYIAEYNSS